MQFQPSVERHRKLVEKYAGDIPVDFLLAWMDKESNGKVDAVSPMGERGLFQVFPGDGEQKMLKLSDADFDKLLTSADFAVKIGVKAANYYKNFGDKLLKKAGATWRGGSVWKLVKLHHAVFGMPKYTILAFSRTNGRGPKSCTELKDFAEDAAARNIDLVPGNKKFSKKLRALTVRWFKNADETGSVIPDEPGGAADLFAWIHPFLRA